MGFLDDLGLLARHVPDDAKNALKGLLGGMPLTQMARGEFQMPDMPTKNGLAEALRGMPKPFDNSPESNAAAMEQAMNYVNPMGLLGKIVYHGSPHKFDKFDASLAGTRGGTSFGMGHNFSADVDHAKVYAGKKGNLYKVDIPDDEIKSFMSWEGRANVDVPPVDTAKPLRFGGGATVEKTELGARLKVGDSEFKLPDRDFQRMFGDEGTGEQIYRKLVASLGTEEAANLFLKKQGINGIKNITERGAENYVVFPGLEDKVKILERNGMPLGLLGQ